MPAKGEFEVQYFGCPNNPAPCGGVNYSAPYTAIPPNDLAPGSVNTQNINGFLCSSPWVASNPYGPPLAAGEYLLGVFNLPPLAGAYNPYGEVIFVTNVKVATATLTLHTWAGGELNTNYLVPGEAACAIVVNSVIYITGLMINGIWCYPDTGSVFGQATNYVCGRWIGELAGRLVVSECIFPTGGGTGSGVLPTVAWSGVGIYGQAWDGNSAHDVWNAANLNFFSGNIGGFNLLEDVPDQITGMGTVGQSIIIVRQNGLTQQDPNGTFSSSGIQPFNWYHMWSSPQGIGGYAGTVAQYGQSLTFRSDDNVYTLSLSAGLSPIGTKIIPRIVADALTAESNVSLFAYVNLSPSFSSFWNFASIYNLNGQLHYLLTFSAYSASPPGSTTPFATCLAYDLNMADGSWHVWDFSQYWVFNPGFSTVAVVGFSCPLLKINQTTTTIVSGRYQSTAPRFFMVGVFGGYGTYGSPSLNGESYVLVPYDYDYNSNPYNSIAALYQPLILPSTTIVFRGETLSLGHKISVRRLRIQADNAPLTGTLASLPAGISGQQQQAQVTLSGADQNSTAQSPVFNMQGDAPPTGQAIRTYYADVVLSDQTIQPSLTSVFQASLNTFPNTASPWQTLCAFRIAGASLIGDDTKDTTQ